MGKEVIAGIALVLIDVFNLAEQFGIYFLSKQSSLDESAQQKFFFILFGIGGATLLQPMFLWSKLQVIFSILIEVGEFIAYLILLPRTAGLIAVATIFLGIEVILHIIMLITIKSNRKEINGRICLRAYCCFPIRVIYYALIYSSPILYLFLSLDSKFRDTYYEVLLILNVFFGVSYIDVTIEQFVPSDDDEETTAGDKISRVWLYITWIIYNILGIVIMITTMVFAGQAIHSNATGEKVLAQYDFGVYIYCLVINGLAAAGQVCNVVAVCIKFVSRKRSG